ncbi:ATP-binding cassette domain-containing protein [Lactobacillus delbrueckii]|uniref:ATP-binding cassette domain-containing protein n=2 Tax=Lactobacillus delbrueckii TaxID=1584 RepID=UPI001023F057|nr:ATP-binding cassette domain-containing protein [Lactobacillus delbrueckii]MCD5536914.1 ATP-binding cassette domain-containing protein [Lactobacillus delbrueckii subsp. lactis]TLQ31871.1 ATP-binding cassette domain-containing protein [Lactobacillus delbrueckii subsp. lactis]
MADRLAGSHQQGQPVLLQSTLLRLIAGLEAPTAGEITMNGQKLSGLNQQAQVMFQDDRLLPWKTVLGNLLMTGNDPDKAKRLLARVGLEEYADAYPATLSGGQRQRAALTRVLLSSPQLLLLDTPLGALPDPRYRSSSSRSARKRASPQCSLPTTSGKPPSWPTRSGSSNRFSLPVKQPISVF